MTYELHYWPGIQGRGEFVRLALEEAAIAYHDIAREKGDGAMPALEALTGGDPNLRTPSFAPPILKAGRLVIGQTSNILLYLGEAHGLAPGSISGRYWTHQLQLTVADAVAEVHDAHHPIAASLYYEDQKPEALRRARHLREERLPKFLAYFDDALARGGKPYLTGARISYADLSLFQLLAGLRFAFPRAMRKAEPKGLAALHDRVAARPRIAAYLASERRIGFTGQGLFRNYEELDG